MNNEKVNHKHINRAQSGYSVYTSSSSFFVNFQASAVTEQLIT